MHYSQTEAKMATKRAQSCQIRLPMSRSLLEKSVEELCGLEEVLSAAAAGDWKEEL